MNLLSIMRKNLYIQMVCVVIVGIICAGAMYYMIPRVVKRSQFFMATAEHNMTDLPETMLLSDGSKDHVVVQNIVPDYQYVTMIGIKFATCTKANRGKVLLEVWDDKDDKCIASGERDMLIINDAEYTKISLDRAISIKEGHSYSIKIKAASEIDSNSFGVYAMKDESGEGIDALLDNKNTDNMLCYSQYGYNDGAGSKRIFLCLLILFSVTAMYGVWKTLVSPDYNSVGIIDIAVVFVAVIALVTLFHQGWDVSITIRHAKDLLVSLREGKPGDFYTRVLAKSLGGEYADPNIRYAAVYNIGIYILTMIIMIPLWGVEHLTGIITSENVWLMYFDAVLALILCLSAYIVYKIVIEMTKDNNIAKRTAFIYLSSYTVLYATIGFCQFDLFYIIFMEWSLLFFLKKKYIPFTLVMSLSIMLKMFPIIIFVPFVLLIEKRIVHIIKYMIIVMVFPLISALITHGDIGYSFSVKSLMDRYGFVGRLFASGINVGVGFGALFIIIISILCVWCFDKDYKESDIWKYVIVIPLVAFTSFFVLVLWHPGWFAMLVPFICIACGIIPKRSLLYCEWGIGVLASLLSIIQHPANVDNYMVNYGVVPLIDGHVYQGISLSTVLQSIHPNLAAFISSLLVALLIYACFVSINGIAGMKSADDNKDIYVKRGIVLARPISIYAFAVLLLITYFYLG